MKKRGGRPLLKTGDPEQVLIDLLLTRGPVYEQADVTVISREVPHEVMVGETLEQLLAFLAKRSDA